MARDIIYYFYICHQTNIKNVLKGCYWSVISLSMFMQYLWTNQDFNVWLSNNNGLINLDKKILFANKFIEIFKVKNNKLQICSGERL